MNKHELKYCPRCNYVFECRVNSIENYPQPASQVKREACQCVGISLSGDERIFISEQYNDCLCISCLKELKEEYIIKFPSVTES